MNQPPASLCIFIPAYNAEKTLNAVINRIPERDWRAIRRLFVIDDGSTDNTASCVADLARANEKIVLFSLSQNGGYGVAVRKGIELSRPMDPDFCVCLHADGQYPPEKLREFTDFMAKHAIDVLQGSRHKSGKALMGNMPLYKYVFGKLLVWLENRVFGLRMTDYHSGYLFYSRKALKTIPFEQFSSSFDFDLEVIAAARARDLNLSELAIETHYGEERSYLNPVTYGFRVLRVLVKYVVGAYEPD